MLLISSSLSVLVMLRERETSLKIEGKLEKKEMAYLENSWQLL